MACLVLTPLCVLDPEPGVLEEYDPDEDVGDEIDNVAESDAADTTEAEDEVCHWLSASDPCLSDPISTQISSTHHGGDIAAEIP